MEIPVINRISDFEAGISSLQNPSFLSQFFALSGIEKIIEAYSFWKWGALILALLASFTTVINRIKILIIRLRLRHVEHSLPSQPLLDDDDEDYDSETDASCSSSDEDEDEEEEETEEAEASIWTSSNLRKVGGDFHTRGSGHYVQWQSRNFDLRRRRGSFGDLFSWSEIATGGKNVVKLWNNLGLGFRLDQGDESSSETVLSFHDTSEGPNVASFFSGKFGIIPTSSPAVVVAVGESESGSAAFSAWDTRVQCQIPAILAEWRPKLGKIVGVGAGAVEKVYIRDEVSGGLTVRDMRKANSPFAELTESDVEKWWDADAVIVTDESVDESMMCRNLQVGSM